MTSRFLPILFGLNLISHPAFAAEGQASTGIHADIQYAQVSGTNLLLDVGVPQAADGHGSFPVAILVHGGGWASGDRNGDISVLRDALTAAGIEWFSIDYRLAPKNQWPACFDDVQTAIRWVKAHAADYHGDPGRVALIGYSAGGELVCLAAAVAKPDTQVQAVVGIAPPNDIPADTKRRGGQISKSLQDLSGHGPIIDAAAEKLEDDMSSIKKVHAGMPPFLLIQGTADKTVDFSQSVNLQAALKAVGVPCDLQQVPGAPHRISTWPTFDPDYQTKMTGWLVKTLGDGKK